MTRAHYLFASLFWRLLPLAGALVLSWGLSLANPARADELTPDSATHYVTELAADAVHLTHLGDHPSAHQGLKMLLTDRFDLEFMARFVLGRHWRNADADMRQAYTRAFAEFIFSTYSQRLKDLMIDDFTVLAARRTGKKDVVVETVLIEGSKNLSMEWRVRDRNGQPKIIDLVVEGVSMSLTHRKEFSAVIQRKGMNALLELLRDPVT